MTLSDVEQALNDSRVLQEFWITGGWDAVVEDEIVDIYPNVESDVEVVITITFPNKIYYRIPLEDVSDIGVNNSLTISLNDLYLDWEERILSYIDDDERIHCEVKNGWLIHRFVGVDGKLRTIKVKM